MIGLSLRGAKLESGGRRSPTLAKVCLKLKHDGHHIVDQPRLRLSVL